MFSKDNQEHLLSLKSEVTVDPAGVGYSSDIDNPKSILKKLNSPDSNPNGSTTKRPSSELVASQVALSVYPIEFQSLSEYDKCIVKSMLYQPDSVTFGAYEKRFLEIFGVNSVTVSTMQDLQVEPASRAQDLFGYDTTITLKDWFAARDS